jgi:hypothetical protein
VRGGKMKEVKRKKMITPKGREVVIIAKYRDGSIYVWMALYRGRLIGGGWEAPIEKILTAIDDEIDKGEWIQYKDYVDMVCEWGLKNTSQKEA